MSKKILVCVCLFSMVCLLPLSSWAALTGNIGGTIVDDTGQFVPGVQITVSGSNLQGSRTAYTNDSGTYRVPLLPPGLYSVTAQMAGMKTVEEKEIEVSLNKTARVDFKMELSTLEEVVVVTAQAPVLDTTSATVGVNIDRSFTERLPENDNFQSAFSMGGGTVGGGNPNVFGGTNTDNTVMFDGMDVTDPVTHTFAQNLNADAIEEVEVQTGGFEAEYGRTMGGIVNAVTKTGGNKFEGIFRIKYETDSFNAPSDDGKPDVEVKDNYEPTLSLGGPILKDKLWFFLSYRRTTVTENKDVRLSYNEADDTYTYASVPNDELWQYGHLNLTYNISEAHNVQFSYTFDPAVMENRGGATYSPAAQYKWEQGGDRYGLVYNWIVSSNFYLSAKVGTFDSYIYVKPQNDSGQPGVYDRDTKIYSVNYPDINDNDRSRTMFNISGSYYVDNFISGSHEFKAGFEWQNLKEEQYTDYAGGRFYEVRSGEPYRYKEYVGEFKTDNRESDYMGFYVQDAWEVMPGLMVKPGLRFETADYYNKKDEKVHSTDMVVGPRLGFAYDINKDGRSKVHASYGRYYKLDDLNVIFGDPGPTPVHNIWIYDPDNPESDPDTGYRIQSSTGGEESSNLLDQDLKPENTDEIIVGYEREILDNFSMGVKGVYRYTTNNWEDIGYYVDENGVVHRVDEINWGSADADGNGVPDDAQDFWDNSRTQGGWYVTNPHGGYRKYLGLILSASAKTENYSLEASYTYSEATGTSAGVASDGTEYNTPFTGGYDDPYSSINLDGKLSYDSPHYFKVNGSYNLPWGFVIGTSAFYRSGYTYSKLIYQPDSMVQGARYINDEGQGAYRMDDVFMVDLSLQKDFDFAKWGILTAIIDITNVLDNQVETDVERDFNEPPEDNHFGEANEWAQPRMVTFQLKYAF